MATTQEHEMDAFVNFFAAFKLTRAISSVADLNDGLAFQQVLSIVDAEYFRTSSRPSAQPSDNWVLRFSALKRLYRLMTQYFSDVLQKPTGSLEVPDLQAMAKDYNTEATLIMCRLTIVIGVQCERNKDFIDKIQGLNEHDQHTLMRVIEQVMAKISVAQQEDDVSELNMTADDHYYQIQSERSQAFLEAETLRKVYQALLDEHRALQNSYDEAVQEKNDVQVQLRQTRKEYEARRTDKPDVLLRAELDRLRSELQKSENNLAMTETELDKNTTLVTDLTRKVDELQGKADEATRLKDQVDEYRHTADKYQKMENVMEKYKKKLQESADMRQHVRALEKQNADLVDKNAAFEEEYRKVAGFKPLMESYKNQIADLEAKNSARTREYEALQFELNQSRARLRTAKEERIKDAETLELYQERLRELELLSHVQPTMSRHSHSAKDLDKSNSVTAGEGNSDGGTHDSDRDVGLKDQGLDGELDNAMSGTTMTDLKIKIRKLTRELESKRKNEADASRILVLENLLEDANRMKARYEGDYLAAHREKLVLQRDLEEIRSGRALGDGTEAAIALRQRLNETLEQLESIRKEHAEYKLQCETLNRDLFIAKSDLALVNKDQLEILASLRESVNEDKVALEGEVESLSKANRELSGKTRMQLEQINGLLLEKMDLQSEGIGHREKLLQRERASGFLSSGEDLPGDVKARLVALQEENTSLRESYKVAQEKLVKAKQFIKSQDKLFKQQHAENTSTALSGVFEEAEASYQSQLKVLEEDLERQKALLKETVRRYRREHELMLSALSNIGMNRVRHDLGRTSTSHAAWLPTQRQKQNTKLQRV